VLGSYERRDGREQKTKGVNDSANTDRTTAIPQKTDSNAGLIKLVYTPSDENRFRLTYDHFDNGTESLVLSAIAKPPLASTSTLGLIAQDSLTRDRVMIDQRYEGSFGFLTEASWAAYYQDSSTVQYTAEDRNTAADRTRRNTFNNRIIGLTAQFGSFLETGAVTHKFVYGGDVSFTRQDGLRDGTIPPVGEAFPTRAFPTTDYTLGGLYVQDEITMLDERLTLYPALRLDFYDLKPKADALLPGFAPSAQDGTHLTPKIGAIARVTDEVKLFANYARGFKAPTPSQVNNFFANPIQNYASLPNPALKPETSQGVEGGIRFNNTWVAAEVSGFMSWYDGFIDQVMVSGSFTPTDPGVFQYQNIGEAKIKGIESKVRLDVAEGFSLNGALSYAHGSSTIGGTTTPLSSIEPFKLVGGLGYRDPDGFFGGQLTATYSAKKSAARVAQTCAPSCFTPPSFTVFDVTTYWNASDWVALRAGVFNLTDEKYTWWSDVRGVSSTSPTLDAYTQPGRNVRASLILKL
jgi:hemoglobin/transferrin/lactoferrin receptor protein